MTQNKSSIDFCDICGRPEEQLEPYELETPIYFHWVTRDFLGCIGKTFECKDCCHVPVYPWEIHGESDKILLFHLLDTDTWSTPIFTWSDNRIDKILSEGSETDEKAQSSPGDYLKDIPKYNYELKVLQPFEVEKIKSAQGKNIIIWPTKKMVNQKTGSEYSEKCGPPEIINNKKSENASESLENPGNLADRCKTDGTLLQM